jgi:hypothetical protein
LQPGLANLKIRDLLDLSYLAHAGIESVVRKIEGRR